jgi:hypothetical protein
LFARLVRAMFVVMLRVLGQDPPQVPFAVDQQVVEALAPSSADPAFGDRVHERRPDVAHHDPDPGIGEDRVECGGVVRSAVADHELVATRGRML